MDNSLLKSGSRWKNRSKRMFRTVWLLVVAAIMLTACASDRGQHVDRMGAAEVTPISRVDERAKEPTQQLPDIFPGEEEELSHFTKAALANRAFSFQWFDAILEAQGDENTVISPYSANMALSMLLRGAEDKTYDQIANALLVAGINELDHMREQALLLRHLINREDVTLSSANSIWHSTSFDAADDYIEQVNEYYGAEITAVDFTDSKTPIRINNWVSEQTRGKIDRIVPDELSPDTFMYLINALYLQAEWTDPFNSEYTSEQPFHLPSGETVQVPMMKQEEMFSAYDGEAVQAVQLGLGDRARFSMTLILPRENKTWPEVRKELEASEWRDSFTKYMVNLTLPKFKIEQRLMLNESFRKLGMEAMFDKTQANLGRMAGWDLSLGPNLFVDQALQKTYLEIDEQGLEAAAVTSIVVVTLSGLVEPPESMTLVFDRPFYFLIEDLESGAVLFIGAVNDPRAA